VWEWILSDNEMPKIERFQLVLGLKMGSSVYNLNLAAPLIDVYLLCEHQINFGSEYSNHCLFLVAF
jgi:hypothetical protein